MNYVPKRLSSEKSILETLIKTKFSEWQYEKEFRILIELTECRRLDGKVYFGFSKELTLKEVIIGANCDISCTQLNDALGDLSRKVKWIKARPAFGLFKIVQKKNQIFGK